MELPEGYILTGEPVIYKNGQGNELPTQKAVEILWEEEGKDKVGYKCSQCDYVALKPSSVFSHLGTHSRRAVRGKKLEAEIRRLKTQLRAAQQHEQELRETFLLMPPALRKRYADRWEQMKESVPAESNGDKINGVQQGKDTPGSAPVAQHDSQGSPQPAKRGVPTRTAQDRILMHMQKHVDRTFNANGIVKALPDVKLERVRGALLSLAHDGRIKRVVRGVYTAGSEFSS